MAGVFSVALKEIKFVWTLKDAEMLSLKCDGEVPELDCFFEGDGKLSLQDRVNEYGEESRVARIERADGGVIELLKRSDRIWEEFKRR